MRKALIKFFIFILFILFFAFVGRFFHIKPDNLELYLKRFPIFLSGIIFIILYVVVTFFIWLSKDIFRIVSAIIFGANLSTFFIWIAEMINAYILFHLSRFLGKEFVEKKISSRRFYYWKDLLEKRRGFLSLFILRAVPLVPFRFMDMFMGLGPISFKRYFLVAFLGSPIRIYWLQFILASLGVGIFKEPTKLIYFLIEHKIIFIISLIYVILVMVLSFILIPKRR